MQFIESAPYNVVFCVCVCAHLLCGKHVHSVNFQRKTEKFTHSQRNRMYVYPSADHHVPVEQSEWRQTNRRFFSCFPCLPILPFQISPRLSPVYRHEMFHMLYYLGEKKNKNTYTEGKICCRLFELDKLKERNRSYA